jgi:hypothetical protein
LKDDPLRAVANRTSERIATMIQGGAESVVPLVAADISRRRNRL